MSFDYIDAFEADSLDSRDFEYYCAGLLQRVGFTQIRVLPEFPEQGVDIVAVKDGIPYAVKCRRDGSSVGRTPVQEVLDGMGLNNCQRGAVMTNRSFTAEAVSLAARTGVLLWDRARLKAWLISEENRTYSEKRRRNDPIQGIPDENKSKKNTILVLVVIIGVLFGLFAVFSHLLGVIRSGEDPGALPGEPPVLPAAETEAPPKPAENEAELPSDHSPGSHGEKQEDAPFDPKRMDMIPSSARTFDAVGYDESRQILVVHIPRYQAYYCYYGFPREAYQQLTDSSYPDEYFNNSIGGRYETLIVPDGPAG